MWDDQLSDRRSSSCCSTPHGQAMYTERGDGFLYSLSRSEGRIAMAGTILSFVHTAGFALALYYLVNLSLESNEGSEAAHNPYSHVCTEAVLCLLFRFGPLQQHTGQTMNALIGQLVYSLVAVGVNLLLVWGALAGRSVGLLLWLIVYLLNIIGSLVLAGIMTATMVNYSQNYFKTIYPGEMGWIALPFVLALLYAILWVLVSLLYVKLLRGRSKIYEVPD